VFVVKSSNKNIFKEHQGNICT